MGIVVVGATFVDIKGFPLNHYIPDGRNAGRIEYVHGGVARNVAEDIANVGLHPTFLSIVDDTPLGADVRQRLDARGVNTAYMLTVPDGMGTWLAVFDERGDVAGSISKRPVLQPIVELLESRGDEIFADADSVVIEVDIDLPLVLKVIELAKKHGTRLYALVSNMSIACERRQLLQQFDCLICNQQEAGLFFRRDLSAATREALLSMLPGEIEQAHLPAMIVTLGEQGAVFASVDGEQGACAAYSVDVADTTGAGDAFCAGVAVGLTCGQTMAQAVHIGTTLAARVITSFDNVCPRSASAEFGLAAER